MKKVLSIVLSIAMVLCMMPAMAFAGTTSAAQADAAYSDTEGLACEGAVNVLSALGVVNGYTDGTYKPEQVVTRAEMAKLIVTALGVDKYATATVSKFTDMGKATWAIPYVEYASNLNIVNGYGYGLFGPNDTVTYEQAVTMIVRALGYTDKCNEMNGSWPAIYVQKATALGLFENVVNGGAAGADRGDVAIMLYNALDVIEVYADQDGQTNYKFGADGAGVTMMDTLNKDGYSYYKVITSGDADTALQNISSYVGAAAKVTEDKNGDVIAVGDVKTVFITGDITADEKNIKLSDGTKYAISSADFVGVNAKTGGSLATSGASVIVNGETQSTYYAKVADITAPKPAGLGSEPTVTLAAKVSGTTVKEIYSVSSWTVDQDAKVDETDINQITASKKLLSETFKKDDNQEIDTTKFILAGVDSLDDIKPDNVVYVYTDGTYIKKVAVGTKVVTGKIDKILYKANGALDKYTIDGTTYSISSVTGAIEAAKAGDEITAWLDYNGKIYSTELSEASTGDFALVISKSASTPSAVATASDAKVEMLTADGSVKVYNVNGKKYLENDSLLSTWSSLDGGEVVKFSLDDNGKVKKLALVSDAADMAHPTNVSGDKYTATAATEVTKAGYVAGKLISEGATIFSVPLTSGGVIDVAADDDNFGVVSKSSIVGTDNTKIVAIYDENGKVVAVVISNDSTTDDQYGIAVSSFELPDSEIGADLWIGTDTNAAAGVVIDGATTVGSISVAKKASVSAPVLYKIKKTASGDYKLDSLDPSKLLGTKYTSSASGPALEYKNGYIRTTSGSSIVASLADDVVIYVFDKSDNGFSIGTRNDITSDDTKDVNIYIDKDSDNTSYEQIKYVTVWKE